MNKLIALLLCFGVGFLMSCQPQTTVDDVVNMMTEANGGAEALAAMTDQVMTLEMTIHSVEGSPTFPITFTAKRPDKIRWDLYGPEGSIVFSRCYDGTTGWGMENEQRIDLTGAQLQDIESTAATFLDGFLNYHDKGFTLELLADEVVDGKNYRMLQVTDKHGNVQKHYINPETYFIERQSGNITNDAGEWEPMVMTFKDYKRIDGITFPHHMAQYNSTGEMTLEMTFKEGKRNAGVDDAYFTAEEMSEKDLLGTAGDRGHRRYDTSEGQWPTYGGDLGNSKYSPLDQINRENVKDLAVVWVWDSPDDALKPLLKTPIIDQFKGTPLMIDGVLYVRTSLNIAVAIDAETGRTLWGFNPESYKLGRPGNLGFTTRGLAYWTDDEDQRLFLATGDSKLFALNPDNGTPIKSFGEDGFVDLTKGLHRSVEGQKMIMNYSMPPVVCRDVVIIGSIVADWLGFFRGKKVPVDMPPGDVRAYDVRTGKMRWRFNTIPQAGEFGVETWEDESWKWVGASNVWTIISTDEELGYAYLPVSSPSGNYYGGFRPGDNLYGQSLVCVDVTTGKRVWHFQTIHHPVWDLDLPAAPNLVDITVNGRAIKAVAQLGKTGFTYVFDRVTGEPVWPIEERPVPTDGVPGEELSPTQPFPTKPPPFERQGVSEEDLIDFTPQHREQAKRFVSQFRTGPMFTPLEKRGTIILPGIGGGANWPGGAFDPESGILYVSSSTLPTLLKLVEVGPDNPWPVRYSEETSFPRVGGWPIIKPPWGRITAIDLNKGEIVWQRANSDGLRYRPRLKPLNLPPLGTAAKSNPMVTKTLLFAPVTGQGVYEPDGKPSPAKLYAYDKTTGDLVWEHPISPAYNDGGAPMTYQWKGRQYIVVPTGGGATTAHLVAFALKREGDTEVNVETTLRPIPTEVLGKVSESEAKGFAVFQARCLGCHTMGYGPLKGPDLLGVHERPRQVLVDVMLLMRLNHGVELSAEEIEQVVNFLKREDAAALLYAELE